MKKTSLLLLPLVFTAAAYGQTIEYSFHVNGGLFSFGGEAAAEYSTISVSDVLTEDNHTLNPYGKEQLFSYGLAVQGSYVTPGQVILGVQAGYELLRSRVAINDLTGEFISPPPLESGQTTLTHGFVTLYPAVGYRFTFNEIAVDLSAGPEIGIKIIGRERGEALLQNGSVIDTDTERDSPGTDIRIRPSLTVMYKNLGISAGYSYGLSDYSDDLFQPDGKVFSRYLRFGIAYKFKTTD